MSAFLITPKTVLDKTACCNASGVSDPIIANEISETSPWGNMAPLEIVDPNKWVLASGVTNGYRKAGTLGYGVCCGSKFFSVNYYFYIGLSFLSASVDYAEMYLTASSNIHDTYSIIITVLKKEDETYEITTITTDFVETKTVLTLEDINLETSTAGTVTATPCSGQAFFSGSVEATVDNNVPLSVTIDVASISDPPL